MRDVSQSADEEEIQAVWERGTVVGNNDPNVWRKDNCGAWIKRDHYGNRNSQYGWEIHHVMGGEDRIPLQWKNNVVTGNGRLQCPVTADGTSNTGT